MKRLLAFVVIAAPAFFWSGRGTAQSPAPDVAQRRGAAPVAPFTADQVQKGRVVYDAHCVSCHGPSLSDGIARSLTGRDFRAHWSGSSPAGLRDYLRRQMPPGMAGSLSQDQYTNLVALLMKENGLVPGDKPLPTDDKTLVSMRMSFPGTLPSSGGLAANAKLPPWPQPPNPVKTLTPVTDAMLRNPPPGDWLTWRRTTDGLGFSPLTQITAANVSGLKLVWSHVVAPGPNVTTPLVHDGVIFVGGPGANVDALDAATGDVLWSFSGAGEAPDAAGARGGRNLALYDDKLYFAMGRGGIGALDARTGKLLWNTPMPASVSGGPLVANGRLFQGLGRSPAGSMQALDAKSGGLLWRWFAIPKTGEPGGNTWGDIPDEKRNGASIWTAAYHDYDLNLMYFGTANTYDTAWLALPIKTKGATRDALYTNSTIALNPETGKMAWYFQHHAGDPYDLDWVFERMIVPLSIDGRTTKAVVTMGKSGVLDALDAATGKYLFSLDAGVQNFFTNIDPVTGAKTMNPDLIPVPGQEKVQMICPNWVGMKNWPPGAINPDTKVAYMALNESCMDMTPGYPGESTVLSSGYVPHTRPTPNSDGKVGRLQAFDLQNRKVVWTERQRAPMTSGVLGTHGGVLFAGAVDRTFSAYDEKTGKRLWSTRLGDVPSSAPITYMAGGKQYVAMVVGFGSMHSMGYLPLVPEIATPARPGSAIYVFALP